MSKDRYPKYDAAFKPVTGRHHQVVIVGGGMIGLTLALDLATRGVKSVLLDRDDTVCTGSRAICIAKRSLEIYARLGLGERMLEKGVTWNTGRVYFGDKEVFNFNLQTDAGQQYPAFVNLQQYHVEAWLVEACRASGLVELRWRHEVVGIKNEADGVELDVKTPDGTYKLSTDWALAADGVHSIVRHSLALELRGREFHEHFLIVDVIMKAPFPTERRFWFNPPFSSGQSALLHKQPDDIWRLDLQLEAHADPKVEIEPERVIRRAREMLGPDVDFQLDWISAYSFRCARLDRFVHGRTVFLGDSAHVVSPFGARGGNGGVQDADNLAWKVAAVLKGAAPEALIASYDDERVPAADENILNSTRATDFITPKSPAMRAYRDAVLELATDQPFARPLINSGRLSVPAHTPSSPLVTPPGEEWNGGVRPGSPAIDAPIEVDGKEEWLLPQLRSDFTLLSWADVPDVPGVQTLRVGQDIFDAKGVLAERYAPPSGAAVLFRPDQHVAARFVSPTAADVISARDRAMARGTRLEDVG